MSNTNENIGLRPIGDGQIAIGGYPGYGLPAATKWEPVVMHGGAPYILPEMTIRCPILLSFIPQPDITTYELARCMAVVLTTLRGGVYFYADNWETELGDLRRHFSRAI